MNTADDKIKNEKEFIEMMNKLLEKYQEAFKRFEREIEALEASQAKFPVKYLSNDAFEDLMLKASQQKHKSISLHTKTAGFLAALESDLDYYEGQILLYFADEFLREKFDKVTDLLRNSYLSSNKQLRQLKKIKGNLKPMKEQAENLIQAFTADEVNFRKFMEVKAKLKGL